MPIYRRDENKYKTNLKSKQTISIIFYNPFFHPTAKANNLKYPTIFASYSYLPSSFLRGIIIYLTYNIISLIHQYSISIFMSKSLKKTFPQVIDFFSDSAKTKKLFKKAETLYLVRSFKVTHMASDQVTQSYQRIQQKYQTGELEINQNDWHKNQRKLFIWFLICYCQEKKISILDVSDKEWEIMANVFFSKSYLFLKFQGLSILKNNKRHTWTPEDDQLLRKSVNQVQQNEWNAISKSIFFESESSTFISAKQCRERWFNHLNQEINKDQWSVEEDLELLKLQLECGKKWSQIARKLETNRTQHMVKNRFNSIINKIRKRKVENEQALTRKAIAFLENETKDKAKQIKRQQKDVQQKIRENTFIQVPTFNQKKEEENSSKAPFLKRIPSRDGQPPQFNVKDLPQGDLRDLQAFVGRLEKGCINFNAEQNQNEDGCAGIPFSLTPSVKSISPGFPNSFFRFSDFVNSKDSTLISPAPQSYSPMNFFSSISPGAFDFCSFLEGKGSTRDNQTPVCTPLGDFLQMKNFVKKDSFNGEDNQ